MAGANGTAYLFAEDRSTPELSFAVRHLGAQAGVEVTASHNPAHDNGYKVYFSDGAQIVEPHASGIIREVEAVPDGAVEAAPKGGGKVVSIGADLDQAYLEALQELVIEGEMLKKEGAKLKVVFTPLHGTGIRIVPAMLKSVGVPVSIVPAQEKGDGRFPTVKSPNPENGEALAMGIELAKRELKRNKHLAIRAVLEMFVTTSTMMLNNLVDDPPSTEERRKLLLLEYTNLRKYVNDSLMSVAKMKSCSVPQIGEKWEWKQFNKAAAAASKIVVATPAPVRAAAVPAAVVAVVPNPNPNTV